MGLKYYLLITACCSFLIFPSTAETCEDQEGVCEPSCCDNPLHPYLSKGDFKSKKRSDHSDSDSDEDDYDISDEHEEKESFRSYYEEWGYL